MKTVFKDSIPFSGLQREAEKQRAMTKQIVCITTSPNHSVLHAEVWQECPNVRNFLLIMMSMLTL